jgi:hypothetical protein
MLGPASAEVRLENDHLLTAIARYGAAEAALRAGDPVSVELSPHEMKGWRVARRP